MNIRFRFLLGSCCLLLGNLLLAQPAQKGLTRLGGLDWPNTTLNDIWGYADSSGHEYALVGTGLGPAVVDLADPNNPQTLFQLARPYSLWWDLKTYGDYAYVSNETGGGILIMDLRYLPDSLPVKDTVIGNTTTIHNLWVDEAGYLYACGGNKSDGLMIMDLKLDPWRPDLVSFYNEAYVHDVYVRNDTAYAAELQNGLTLIDLSDRSNPVSFNNRNYPASLTHNTWLSEDGRTCFTTDEVLGGYTIAWDVSNPNNITELDRYRSQRDAVSVPHNVHVEGPFLIISHYREGVVVVDATHPAYLVEVAHYDTSPLSGGSYDGCWGAYPYLPSGLILSTDVLEGLDVLQPTYRGAGFVDGVVLDAVTGQPLSGVIAGLNGLDSVDTDISGRFLLGQADSGEVQLSLSLPGYLPRQIDLSLYHDSTRQDTFFLIPFPQGSTRFELVSAADGHPLREGRIETQVVVGTDTLHYAAETDSLGQWQATQMLAGQHRILAGKWGYLTLDTTVAISDSTQTVRLALLPGYRDAFALDLGWQTTGNQLFGEWIRARPVGTNLALGSGFPASPAADLPNDLGGLAYLTGQATGPGPQSAEDQDLDGGTTFLVSPVMDLSGYERPRLRLHWWLTNSSNPDSGSISQGGGSFNIRVVTSGSGQTIFASDTLMTRDWLLIESDTLPRSPSVQIIVQAMAGLETDVLEAGIDLMEIFEGDPQDTVPLSQRWQPVPSRLWVAGQSATQLSLGYALPPDSRDWQVHLYDLTGRLLQQQHLPVSTSRLALPFAHPPGLYLMILSQGGRVQQAQRFQWR